ncbi:MAG: cytochrome c oxidase subunit II [Acidobacteria bacterium]|nr:cytochrome c oxidase subunit II [Acidobacteriota bacterium]
MSKLLGLPLLASEHGGKIDQLIIYVHIMMVVLFVGWGLFFAYTLIRFRKSRHPIADYTGVTSHTSTKLEIGVAVAEIWLLVGLSIPFWATEIATRPSRESNPLEVRVIAQQFAWNVHYPGPDGVFGRTTVALVNEQTNPLGLDPEDPHGSDDVTTINQLYLPSDRRVVVNLSTKDVIHSFSLPEFRVKQDIIPGMSIPVSFVPTMTTATMREIQKDEKRNFEIACAQLCGLGHYRMRGFVTILPEEEFQNWLDGQVQEQQEGEDDIWG